MMGDTKDDENKNSVGTEESSSSWWGGLPGWFQTAKEKSSNALEFMKRDLTELSQVVQTDAVAAVSSTAAMLKEKLTVDNVETVAIKARDSVSSFLEVLSDVFVPMKEIEDGEPAEAYVIKNSEPVILGWWQAQLYNIRRDPKTYCHEPEGPPEMYENWMESFDLDDYEEEMANMMLECHEVRCLYDQLVPSSVSHSEFWHRYFYRVYLLKKAEAKRNKELKDVNNEAEIEAGIDVTEKENVKENATVNMSSENFGNSLLSKNAQTLYETKEILNLDSYNKDSHTMASNVQQNVDRIIPDNEVVKTLKHDLVESGIKLKQENESSECCSEISNMTHGKYSPAEIITDENRSTPSDTPSKEYSTGDEWEKDFDLEINTEELKSAEMHSQKPKLKEGQTEEGWEKC